MKLHRTSRTTALQQDYWGFSSETAQKYLEESNRWMQYSKSPPFSHSPSHCPEARWSRRQPRQSRCVYLESQLRTARSQKSSFAEPIYHRTQGSYHQSLTTTGSAWIQQCLRQDKQDFISSPTAQDLRVLIAAQRPQGRWRWSASTNYPRHPWAPRARSSLQLRQLTEPK